MFPDYQVRKEWSFGQDDWVCLEVEESGTMKGAIHSGPREVQPTGKSFKIPSSIIVESMGVVLKRCVSISMFLV